MWQFYFGNFVNLRIKTEFTNLKGISLRVIFIMVFASASYFRPQGNCACKGRR